MIIREDDFDVLTPEQAESKTPDKTPGDDQPSDQQGDSGDKPGITGGQSGQDAQDGKPGESSGQSGDQSSDDTIDLTGMTQEEFDELVKQIIAKSKEEDIDENETGLGGVITPEQSKHIQEELGIPVKTVRALIGEFLATDFPHEVRLARPTNVVNKKKDGKCTIA